MVPIIEYPAVVSKHLPGFEKCFRRPEQLQHFAEYVTGLIVCIRHNVKHMNDQFLNHRDQSTKNRFLTESPWAEHKVNRKRIRLILKKVKGVSPRKCTLAIDDTLLEHESDTSMKQIALFRDPSSGNYEHGHIIVTTHLMTPLGQFPISFRLYYPKGRISKITLAKWLVRAALRYGLPFGTVVFDAWYLSSELTEFLAQHGKSWVSRGKSNRVAFLNGRKQPIVGWLNTLPPEAVSSFEVDGKSYQAVSKSIRLANHTKVRLVALKDPSAEAGWTLLFCNKFDWSADGIVRAYKRRWNIETFYRDAKQNLGLEDYVLRNITGTKRHWHLVFVAYTLLELSALDAGLMKAITANAVSLGDKCRDAMRDVGRSFILWVARQTAMGKAPNEIFDMAYLSVRCQSAA